MLNPVNTQLDLKSQLSQGSKRENGSVHFLIKVDIA